MPARKAAESVEVKEKSAPSALPGNSVRSLEPVAEAIRAMFAEGKDADTILKELEVSPHVFRELLSHSYKMVGRAPEVFEYQERVRIGEIEG